MQRALIELRRTTSNLELRQSEAEAALLERDRAIVAAAAAGLTRRRIAGAVGLSAARVQQICNASADGVGVASANGGDTSADGAGDNSADGAGGARA